MKNNQKDPIILLIILLTFIFAISYGIDLLNFIIKVKLFKWFI
ncbi:hypothetical protein [Fusobacterium mortiferum]|nr:hypothetical protein [Fusobacterium mortiferum]